jgi:aryl-alcohol dehydrogenase-like predicted oxidoreductase
MRIPGIDRTLSALALGSHYYRLADASHWHAILDGYLEAGGTLLDTARSYGESEQVIGRWLADRAVRERLTLLTKGGHGTRHGVTEGDFAATIEAELSTSLEVLGTEQVELYLLHRDSPAFEVGTIIEALNVELRRGRVRAIGASNWEYDRIEQANAYARERGLQGFGVISNHLALARSAQPFWPGLVSVGQDGWNWHRRTGTPLLVFSSQARGFFSGRFEPRQRDAAPGTLGTLDPLDARVLEVYGSDANFARLERARRLGRDLGGYSATQVALAWLLHQPLPLLPIIGPRDREELASSFDALSLSLTRAETRWLDTGTDR